VQGRQPEQARKIVADAVALEAAGAALLVLECVPRTLAAEITRTLRTPVIGIGAGPETDAQVLVLHDMLGLNAKPPKFVRNFLQGASSVQQALTDYRNAVVAGSFPGAEHCFD